MLWGFIGSYLQGGDTASLGNGPAQCRPGISVPPSKHAPPQQVAASDRAGYKVAWGSGHVAQSNELRSINEMEISPIILGAFSRIYFVPWTERLSTDERQTRASDGERCALPCWMGEPVLKQPEHWFFGPHRRSCRRGRSRFICKLVKTDHLPVGWFVNCGLRRPKEKDEIAC
jgi:hypothetical protein